MEKSNIRYSTYIRILKEELVPAMGCTEPIAIAYCAARTRDLLGGLPDSCVVEASGNIIKNVKSVVVPNADGLRGIEAAAAAGIVAGDASRVLEVISQVTVEQKQEIRRFLSQVSVTVRPAENAELLDIRVTLTRGEDMARVRIAGYHTNIVCMEKNGEILYQRGVEAAPGAEAANHNLLDVEDIIDFADSVDPEDLGDVIERQIRCNMAIAEEGITHDWGANVGKVILKTYGNDVKHRARAMAAAGSDARMSGCEMPVIINSGSGNQGMTASIPVIVYARELGVSHETMIRALVVSNLITIHQKTGIGRLSAYCGAISAGCGAGCGIAYLQGGRYREIAHTLVNALATVSGIVCDGAKPSCAAKIAAAVEAGILGYHMFLEGQQFRGGDGLISKGVENTIRNIGRLGSKGMRETDREIIRMMTDGSCDRVSDSCPPPVCR